jgi:hypothetical protein
MGLEQEGRPSVHPPTDLKGFDSAIPDNAIDDELVGRGLGDQFLGFLDKYAVALAHDESGKLAKVAKAVAQRIDRMAFSPAKSWSIKLVQTCRKISGARRTPPKRWRQRRAMGLLSNMRSISSCAAVYGAVRVADPFPPDQRNGTGHRRT